MDNNIIKEGLEFIRSNKRYTISNIRRRHLLDLNSNFIADINNSCNIITTYNISEIEFYIKNGIWKMI